MLNKIFKKDKKQEFSFHIEETKDDYREMEGLPKRTSGNLMIVVEKPLTKFQALFEQKWIVSQSERAKLRNYILDWKVSELKDAKDHGRLWFRCSGAYA